jgi:hypothetical protein
MYYYMLLLPKELQFHFRALHAKCGRTQTGGRSRWWQHYCADGLAALVAPPRRRGPVERLTPAAWAGLQAEMRAGHIGGLHEAQVSRRDTWHIDDGIDALSKLFRRRKTKLKTGRPRHRKAASAAEQAAFKK